MFTQNHFYGILIVAILGIVGLCLGGNNDVINISHEEQLLLDDYLIANATNITRQIHPAMKYPANPVLWPTEPWESKTAVIYGSVIRDGDKFKMWYKAGQGVGYAESWDGIKWIKPQLDLVTVDGQKTNVLFRKREKFLGPEDFPTFYEIFGVHKDDSDPDPSHRYKMGYLSIIRPYKGPRIDPFHPTDRRGMGVAGSPDGIHWKLIDPFATEAICDGDTHWMLDPARNKYVLFGRTKKTLPEVEKAWSQYDWYENWHSGRSSARLESADFLKWDFSDPATAPVVITADIKDEPGTEIYSMQVFPYESVYIGLVQAFIARPDACYLEIQLAVSHDTYNFTRVGDRTPFIPVGPIGSWDRFNNSLANNPPIAVGDELRFYYGGRTYRHGPYKGKDKGVSGGGIGFATIKRGRFVSLDASFDGGTIVTKPLIFQGSQLFLNVNTAFGSIQVTLLDEQGNAIPEWVSTLSGENDIAIPVHFNQGDLKKFAGEKIKIQFDLENAQLFGFRISY